MPRCNFIGWNWSGWCASRAGWKRPAQKKAMPTTPVARSIPALAPGPSPQSQVVDNRGVLVANAARYAAQYLLNPPRPPHWGGYRLVPVPLGVLARTPKPLARPAALYPGCATADGCVSGWRLETRGALPHTPYLRISAGRSMGKPPAGQLIALPPALIDSDQATNKPQKLSCSPDSQTASG